MNMFADCTTASEVVFQALGAGSMCWENVRAAGEFDSGTAKSIGDDALARLKELKQTPQDARMPWDGDVSHTKTLDGQKVLRGSSEAAQDLFDRHEASKR